MPIVGDVLAGRYRIDAPIGAGGMASVYRAYDLRLERNVAVKVLLPNLAADPTVAQRFGREALALAATAHPSVVKVFDVEPSDPATGREPFYVMELCEGGSLADRLVLRGRLEPGELVAAVAAIADGLADLHRRGFVHRDVKPHNILFDEGRARLADFGLARSEERSDLTALTMSRGTVGTLAYLAPELLSADPATPASDVYALGVVVFQGLTGRLPRPATSIRDLVALHSEPVPAVSSIAPELGAVFDAPVAASLASNPESRPTPLDLAEQLTNALDAPRPGATVENLPVVPLVAASEHAFVDPSAATQVDIRPDAEVHAQGASGFWPHGRWPAIAVALTAFGILLLTLAALSSFLGNEGGRSAAGPTMSAGATPVGTATPTATSMRPTTPPAVGDPAAEAYAVLGRIDAAIEDLADEDDIRDRDLDALRRRAGDVRDALAKEDFDEALNRVARLDDEVDRIDDRIVSEAMDRVKNAVSDLDEAIPAD